MTNTSKQVENQHLMGLFLEKETETKKRIVDGRQKERKQYSEIIKKFWITSTPIVCASTFFWHVELKISSYLDNVFLRIFIPHSELI